MFSFYILLLIGPQQEEARCASSNVFQYGKLLKKGISEKSSFQFTLNHCYLTAESIHSQNSINSWNKVHKNTVTVEEPIYVPALQHFQRPTTSTLLSRCALCSKESSHHSPWLLELRSAETQREQRQTAPPATFVRLELPSCGWPVHAFHHTALFTVRPLFKESVAAEKRGSNKTAQVTPTISCWKSKLQSMYCLQSSYYLAACSSLINLNWFLFTPRIYACPEDIFLYRTCKQ